MQDKLRQLLDDESFQRWLENTASIEEKNYWKIWLREKPDHRVLLEEANTLWKKAQFVKTASPEIEQELQKLQSRLHFDNRTHNYTHPGTTKSFWHVLLNWIGSIYKPRPVFAIAVIVLFIIALGKVYFIDNHATVITTEFGERQTIELVDGSQIILNANSTLRYTDDLAGTVVFLHGEAFFDIAPQAGWNYSFKVTTEDGQVEVVGTKFNINERGDGTQVVVEEGCVRAESYAQDSKCVELHADDLLYFTSDDTHLKKQRVDSRIYTSWHTDRLVFNKTSLKDIIARLEATYDVTMIVHDKELLEQTISGSIENTNLKVIIQALGNVTQTTVKFAEQTVYLGK